MGRAALIESLRSRATEDVDSALERCEGAG